MRHDWKKHTLSTIHSYQAKSLPIPAHFGLLSPEARLAYLQERRNVDPVRFDHYHPHLGPLLSIDDRMRAAQSQNCMPMNGILPDNSLTRYLDYRRSIDPARFDHYHPALGAILVEDQKLKAGQGCVAGEIIPPPIPVPPPVGTPSPGPPAGGGPLPPRLVPEPTSLVLILLGSATMICPIVIRRWNRRIVTTD